MRCISQFHHTTVPRRPLFDGISPAQPPINDLTWGLPHKVDYGRIPILALGFQFLDQCRCVTQIVPRLGSVLVALQRTLSFMIRIRVA